MQILAQKRAKATPLEININPRDTGKHDWLPTPYLQQTQSLNMNQLPVAELKEVIPNFPKSTPNLRSLTLSTSTSARWDQTIDSFQ